MGPMLNEFTREELQNQFPGQKGQEAAVLGQGTGMITGRRITGREATAEVGVDMKRNGIVAGPGIIAVEVGAEAEVAVLALDIAETVEEAKMMMRGVVEVGLMGGTNFFVLYNCFMNMKPIGVCSSASPARSSLSPQRSPSPCKTTSRGGSPDARNYKERSPTPKSVSPPRRDTDFCSPTPRSDVDE